jgi:large subunit ribosomal protein L18
MSYKLGQMFGVLLKEKGIKKASFDRNGFKYSGRISKLADGIRESGVYI